MFGFWIHIHMYKHNVMRKWINQARYITRCRLPAPTPEKCGRECQMMLIISSAAFFSRASQNRSEMEFETVKDKSAWILYEAELWRWWSATYKGRSTLHVDVTKWHHQTAPYDIVWLRCQKKFERSIAIIAQCLCLSRVFHSVVEVLFPRKEYAYFL